MSGESPYQVTLRHDWAEVESCAGYRDLRLVPTFLDVGTWTVQLRASSPAARMFLTEHQVGDDLARWGIVARRAGTPSILLSGVALDAYVVDTTSPTLTLVGVCDNAIAAGETAWPDTTTEIPTATTTTHPVEYDSRTGPAETVLLDYVTANIGPAAPITRRRYPWLTIPTSQGRGTTRTWHTRQENLLQLQARIARAADLGFRYVQGDPGLVTLDVWAPQLRPEARFSRASGTISTAELVLRAVDSTEALVAGPGEGTARVFTRQTRTGVFAFRRARFLDRDRNPGAVPVYDALQTDATEQLITDAVTAGFTFTPTSQTGGLGSRFDLGDIVTGVVAAQEITDVVEQVTITHTAGQAPKEVPSIGLPNPDETPELEHVVRRLATDVGRKARS